MKSFVITVLVALLFFLALMFGARNDQVVTISYFVAQGKYSLPAVLAVVFLAGFVISWLLSIYQIICLRFKVHRQNKSIEALNGQLEETKKQLEELKKPPEAAEEKKAEEEAKS